MNFYRIESPSERSTLAWWATVPALPSENFDCLLFGKEHPPKVEGYTNLFLDIRATKVPDMFFASFDELIVNSLVRRQLEDSGLTGIEFRKAEVLKVKGDPELARGRTWDLFEIRATGFAGLASPESGVHFLRSCAGCGRTWFSPVKDPAKLISEKDWDGTDCFVVWPFAHMTFVSEKFRTYCLKKLRWKNCFVPQSRMKFIEQLMTDSNPKLFESSVPPMRAIYGEVRAVELAKRYNIPTL